MLLPPGRTIAEFLSALPEAPALKEIERSVKVHLKNFFFLSVTVQ